MRNGVRFAAFLLTACEMFAQHGGGARGSSGAGSGHVMQRAAARGTAHTNARVSGRRRASRQRFSNGFFAPYYPVLGGDYGDGYLAGNEDTPPPVSDAFIQPNVPTQAPESSPARIGPSILENYSWNTQSAPSAAKQATFTIALRDGSTRSAVATWVQGRTLHYIDSNDSPGALSSELIDRDSTRRMNKEKKMSIQLPPA